MDDRTTSGQWSMRAAALSTTAASGRSVPASTIARLAGYGLSLERSMSRLFSPCVSEEQSKMDDELAATILGTN